MAALVQVPVVLIAATAAVTAVLEHVNRAAAAREGTPVTAARAVLERVLLALAEAEAGALPVVMLVGAVVVLAFMDKGQMVPVA